MIRRNVKRLDLVIQAMQREGRVNEDTTKLYWLPGWSTKVASVFDEQPEVLGTTRSNLLLFGGPGSGISNLLLTVTTSICELNKNADIWILEQENRPAFNHLRDIESNTFVIPNVRDYSTFLIDKDIITELEMFDAIVSDKTKVMVLNLLDCRESVINYVFNSAIFKKLVSNKANSNTKLIVAVAGKVVQNDSSRLDYFDVTCCTRGDYNFEKSEGYDKLSYVIFYDRYGEVYVTHRYEKPMLYGAYYMGNTTYSIVAEAVRRKSS